MSHSLPGVLELAWQSMSLCSLDNYMDKVMVLWGTVNVSHYPVVCLSEVTLELQDQVLHSLNEHWGLQSIVKILEVTKNN